MKGILEFPSVIICSKREKSLPNISAISGCASDQVGVCIELHYGNVLGTTSLLLLGSFGNDDDDSSANNTVKMNSRFLKLCQVYSNSIKMSNVGRFLWSQILVGRTQV